MQIHGENECTICGNTFKYDFGYKPIYDDNGEIKYEVRIITDHPRCRKIVKKIEECKAVILDSEFELFCMKYNYCKYNSW